MTSISPVRILSLGITLAILFLFPDAGQGQNPVKPIYPDAELNKRVDEALKTTPIEREIASIRKKMSSKEEWDHFGAVQDFEQIQNHVPKKKSLSLLLELLEIPAAKSDRSTYPMMLALVGGYGPEAKDAAPKLLAMCKERGVDRRNAQAALFALLEIIPGNPDLLPLLIDNIDSANGMVKDTILVLDAIGRYGAAGSKALRRVEAYLTHDHAGVAFQAFKTSGRLHDSPQPPLADLLKRERFKAEGGDKGYAVLMAVQRNGKKLESLTPKLIQELNAKHPPYYRMMLMETLGKVGQGNAQAVQALLDRIALEPKPVQSMALFNTAIMDVARAALNEQVRKEDIALIAILAKALSHPDVAVRTSGIENLKKFGKQAAPAVDALARAIKEADENTPPELFVDYLSLARELGKAGKPIANALVDQLSVRSKLYKDRPSYYVQPMRNYIFVSLADIEVPMTALPFIVDDLNKMDNLNNYAVAAHAAAVLGVDAKEAVPGLLRALSPELFLDNAISLRSFEDLNRGYGFGPGEGNTTVRIEAIRALARIGPEARAALPALKRLVDEKPPTGRQVLPWKKEAEDAIRAIEGK